MGFFWSAKARENATVSEQTISRLELHLEILNSLQSDLGNQTNRMKQLESEIESQKQIFAEAMSFPNTLETVGIMSIFVLAAGTLLQLMSLA